MCSELNHPSRGVRMRYARQVTSGWRMKYGIQQSAAGRDDFGILCPEPTWIPKRRQAAQDAQDAKTRSDLSRHRARSSDTRSFFADGL